MSDKKCGSHVEMQSTDLIRLCEHAIKGSQKECDECTQTLQDEYGPEINKAMARGRIGRFFRGGPDDISDFTYYPVGPRAKLKYIINNLECDHKRRCNDFKRLITAASYAETVFVTVEDVGYLTDWSTR